MLKGHTGLFNTIAENSHLVGSVQVITRQDVRCPRGGMEIHSIHNPEVKECRNVVLAIHTESSRGFTDLTNEGKKPILSHGLENIGKAALRVLRQVAIESPLEGGLEWLNLFGTDDHLVIYYIQLRGPVKSSARPLPKAHPR